MDVVVIGGGPAGSSAALCAAELGARTTLVTRGEFAGMSANDGPIQVPTLAHAARLLRETRRLAQHGITVSEPILDYPQLLVRTREIVDDVCEHSTSREHLERMGVTIYEQAGPTRFIDQHTVETESGLRLRANKIILSAGGTSRRLSVPGFEWTATDSDAWGLTAIPASMLVVGAETMGVQVASIFQTFGSRVQLFEPGPRILATEDDDMSAAVAAAFRQSGMVVRENFGTIESFEKTASGVRMIFSKDGRRDSAEGALVVAALGWMTDTAEMNLSAARVETDPQGYVLVDAYLQTSAPNILAAGGITGRQVFLPQAVHDGFVAATNAVEGPTMTVGDEVSPIGRFTNPEYAHVGLTELKARETHDMAVAVVHFDETQRTIIDGQTTGFCKLIAERATGKILGFHVVGEYALEIVQAAAVAIAGGLRVADLAKVPLSFPTYVAILGRAASRAAQQIYPEFGGPIQSSTQLRQA
jgi:pyruvate/2-oxoglutarate dehydrogenase complex dihydrolipoamide dehydrogenase (E3) component